MAKKRAELPDFEQIVDDIRTWLRAHGKDPHAGMMLSDFLEGNCAHDFDTDDTCELCGAATEGS